MSEQRDIVGNIYDSSWTDSNGTRHYSREHARGTAAGPAYWSDEHDCNPICGHHLASKCTGCQVCIACDGCYCREREYELRDDGYQLGSFGTYDD